MATAFLISILEANFLILTSCLGFNDLANILAISLSRQWELESDSGTEQVG